MGRRPTIDCHLIDGPYRRKARVLAASILIHIRAHKRGRPSPPAVAALVEPMTPLAYHWHFFAWKLGGFRRGVDLATTPDHKVVVIRDDAIIIGNPTTEETERVDLTGNDIDVDLPVPANALLVQPKSRYRYH